MGSGNRASGTVAVLGCTKGQLGRVPLPAAFRQGSQNPAENLLSPSRSRQVGEGVLFMQEIGSGFRKDGLKYEDITQDLPGES